MTRRVLGANFRVFWRFRPNARSEEGDSLGVRFIFDEESCGAVGFWVRASEMVAGWNISEVYCLGFETDVKNGFPGPFALGNTHKKSQSTFFFYEGIVTIFGVDKLV